MAVLMTRSGHARGVSAGAAVLALLGLATPAGAAGDPPPSFERDIKPLLVTYCYDCHGDGSAKGDVDFDAHTTAQARTADGQLWYRVWENVRNGIMPPPRKPRPTAAEAARLEAWIRREVQHVDCSAPDPGRVTLRRLNRDEYNHSIGELFGIDFQPAEDFPADDSGYGFDDIGDVLSVSPVLTEKYFNAAEQIVARVVAQRGELPRRTLRRGDLKVVAEPADKVSEHEGRFTLDQAGTYTVDLKTSVNSFRPFTGEARVRVELDGRPLLRATYRPGNRPYRYAYRRALARGEHVVRFFLDQSSAIPDSGRAVTVALEELSVAGPAGTRLREYPPAHRRLFVQGPAPRAPDARRAYARSILEGVASRAFRRPVDEVALARLLELAERVEKQSGRFESGIASALQAILVSPRFLFRVEEALPGQSDGQQAVLIDEHALATRLSYLLHAAGPDQQLMALAARGALRENLDAQVSRLLADPRSERFVSRFVGQWLRTRDVESVPISSEKFRVLSPAIRKLMREETELLFAHVMRQDRDVMELLTADYTFLNAALADFYKLPGVTGSKMRVVPLPPDSGRGGLLTHGSFLTVTSNPTRTSPVKRGLYLLDNVLGAPPPPPPPNVPNLEDAASDGTHPKTMRAQLAAHRAKPACAGCHARMDPLGLALETFDAIGRRRDSEDGHPIDATGTLVTGEVLAGAQALRDVLATRRPQFYRTLTRKLLTFALGRGLEPADECTVDRLVAELVASGGRVSTLVAGIAHSRPFQMRRGSP
jgi:hypothetical protein